MSRLRAWLTVNPLAIVLLFLLALAELGNWRTGRDLQRVCALLGEHDVSVPRPITAREEIDNICIAHQSRDTGN